MVVQLAVSNSHHSELFLNPRRRRSYRYLLRSPALRLLQRTVKTGARYGAN